MKRYKLIQYLLSSILVVAICLGVVSWNEATSAQSLSLKTAGLSLEKVASGIYTLVSQNDFPNSNPNGAICNVGIVIGDEGVLVVDPLQTPALGDLVLDTVKTLTDKPVRYVVNTHFHFDHTGGNPAFASKGIPIIGRGAIRQLMLAKNKQYDPNPQPPEVIVKNNASIWLGNKEVVLQEVEGHTPGTDLVVYVKGADVLFTGDLMFYQRFPYMGDGNLKQWQNTLVELQKSYPSAKVVPGHGMVINTEKLVVLKNYLDYLEQLALGWKQRGISEAEALASAAEIPKAYRDYKFQIMYSNNLQVAYQQITAQN